MLFRFIFWRRRPRRSPTIHSFRLGLRPNPIEVEYARLKRLERYNFYLQQINQIHREIGREVDEAMRMPEEPHEQLTEYQTRPTKIIPLDYDQHKTQPLLDTPEKGQ